MTLADLRRLAVRKSLRIRFQLENGMECVLDEHGVARIPALHSAPGFSLEDQVESVRHFTLESLADAAGRVAPATEVSSEQLAGLAGGATAAHSGHDEEE